MRVLFKSHNLIGDALNISPALRRWIKFNEAANDCIYLQTLPDHIAPLYKGMVRDLVTNFHTVFERPEGTFDFEFDFNVSTAFDLCDKNKYHIAEGYAEMLGVKLEGGNERLKPVYIPEDDGVQTHWGKNEELKGCILISMFSASCTSRDANTKGLPPNKMLLGKDKNGEWKSYAKWRPMLELIKKEYPATPVKFLGAPTDVLPEELKEYGEAMFGIPLNRLFLIMQKAKLLVTIDCGMSHLGAAAECPTFLLYPRCLSPHYIVPFGNPNLVYVQMDPVYVNPAQLVHGLQFAINKFKAQEQK